ncbi:hypothetical protein BKA93DRAFT_737045 [Sparassis latifolia]
MSDLHLYLQDQLSSTDETVLDPDIQVTIHHDCIYQHTIARINYTTYDVQRDQDLINPRIGKCAIMVYHPTTPGVSSRPWVFASVLDIYHTLILRPGMSEPKRMEFLWVRWMHTVDIFTHGPAVKHMKRVAFEPLSSPNAFGFINPAQVIRACHLIPAFHHIHITDLPSVARDPEGDWRYYYVNRCVMSH